MFRTTLFDEKQLAEQSTCLAKITLDPSSEFWLQLSQATLNRLEQIDIQQILARRELLLNPILID
jgi:hypothetical protein